jgi:hypothetical protein
MARDGVRILVTSASGANGNGYGAVLGFGPRVISPGRSAATRGSLIRAACLLTRRARWST